MTQYVDDGEHLHGIGDCGVCVFCGRPRAGHWPLSFACCVLCDEAYKWHPRAEYARRVSNALAAPVREKASEPVDERAEWDALWQAEGLARGAAELALELTKSQLAERTAEVERLRAQMVNALGPLERTLSLRPTSMQELYEVCRFARNALQPTKAKENGTCP